MKSLSDLSKKEQELILAVLQEDIDWMIRLSESIPQLKIEYPKDFRIMRQEMIEIIHSPEKHQKISSLTKEFMIAFLENDYTWLVNMLEKLVWKRRLLHFVWKIGSKLAVGRGGFEVIKDVIENIKLIPEENP